MNVCNEIFIGHRKKFQMMINAVVVFDVSRSLRWKSLICVPDLPVRRLHYTRRITRRGHRCTDGVCIVDTHIHTGTLQRTHTYKYTHRIKLDRSGIQINPIVVRFT